MLVPPGHQLMQVGGGTDSLGLQEEHHLAGGLQLGHGGGVLAHGGNPLLIGRLAEDKPGRPDGSLDRDVKCSKGGTVGELKQNNMPRTPIFWLSSFLTFR